MAGDRGRCLAIDISDYLAKPLDRDQPLVKVVSLAGC
jgi:hypothetical protein